MRDILCCGGTYRGNGEGMMLLVKNCEGYTVL